MAKGLLHRLVANFNFCMLGLGLTAIAVRLGGVYLADAPVGHADAITRVYYSIEWSENPFIFRSWSSWPPLQFYIYGAALRIFPDVIYTPLVVNILFGGLLAVLMGYLSKQLTGDREVGLFTGAIVALYPLAIRLSLVALPEIMLSFLIFLSLFLLIKSGVGQAGQLQARYVISAAFTMALAEWTHYEAWYLMPLFSLLLWGRWKNCFLFVTIAAIPIVLLLLNILLDHPSYEYMRSAWQTASFDLYRRSPLLTSVLQILYYPALLIKTLSPVLILTAVSG